MGIQDELSQMVVSFLTRTGSSNMYGGGKGFTAFVYLFFVFLLLLLVKAYIVKIAYNHVMPSLMYSLDVKSGASYEELQTKHFRPIVYVEAILVVILFNMLFTRV